MTRSRNIELMTESVVAGYVRDLSVREAHQPARGSSAGARRGPGRSPRRVASRRRPGAQSRVRAPVGA